jgi:transposase
MCKKYEKGGFTQKQIAQFYGISLKTFSKWWRRYNKGESLENRSTRPKTFPKITPREIEDDLIRIRCRTNFNYKRCAYEYNKTHDKKIKPSTVHKIFKRRGIYKMNKNEKKKKPKLYCKSKPGEVVQVDIKYTPKIDVEGYLINYYQFTAIDDCTRTEFLSIYESMSKANAINFSRRLKSFYPFKIEKIKTDHGPQFTNDFMPNQKNKHEFTKILEELGIEHKLIPIGHPQSNGKVERAHLTADTDFYNINTFNSLNDFQKKATKYLKYYNEQRPHEGYGMNMMTPLEKLLSFE